MTQTQTEYDGAPLPEEPPPDYEDQKHRCAKRPELALAPLAPEPSGMMQVAATRAAQEVQAAMVIAKKFPRDETVAFQRIIRACHRKSLAEEAVYAYPRGNTTVSGPSIRMAEVLALNWGNIHFGIHELERREGESSVLAFAWDLETNTRQSKVFTVPHERRVGKGSRFRVDQLTDPRDIYEMTANQGARRLRACILGVIPGDVVEAAVVECEKTMAGNNAEPLIDRARKMLVAFEGFGVTKDQIEGRLGHKVEVLAEVELVGLRKVYAAIQDNFAAKEDFFPATGPAEGKVGGKTPAEPFFGGLTKPNGQGESATKRAGPVPTQTAPAATRPPSPADPASSPLPGDGQYDRLMAECKAICWAARQSNAKKAKEFLAHQMATHGIGVGAAVADDLAMVQAMRKTLGGLAENLGLDWACHMPDGPSPAKL